MVFELGIRTSNTHSRPDIHLNGCFFRQFIASRYFDWPIDSADDGIAIVCVSCRAVCAIKMRECYCRGDHCIRSVIIVYARVETIEALRKRDA
jgi:hypothetical protein